MQHKGRGSIQNNPAAKRLYSGHFFDKNTNTIAVEGVTMRTLQRCRRVSIKASTGWLKANLSRCSAEGYGRGMGYYARRYMKRMKRSNKV
jgi:hypothetical protein